MCLTGKGVGCTPQNNWYVLKQVNIIFNCEQMKSINSNHTKADCEIIVFSYLLIISISLLSLSSVISLMPICISELC